MKGHWKMGSEERMRAMLIVHPPAKSARDVIRCYMIQLFPSNDFLVQKIDTLFPVIDWIFLLNTLKVTKKASHWSAMCIHCMQ